MSFSGVVQRLVHICSFGRMALANHEFDDDISLLAEAMSVSAFELRVL